MVTKSKSKKQDSSKKETKPKKTTKKKIEKVEEVSKKSESKVSRKKRLLPHNLLLELDDLRSSISILESELKIIKESLQRK